MTSTLPPLIQAFSGAAGSAAANASAYPLNLVCTRLQTSELRQRQGFSSTINTLQRIIRQRGIIGLYDGLETDTAAALVSSFFYYYAYSFLRNQVFKRRSTKVSTAVAAPEEIAIGYLAGLASRSVSTPLSLITVRLQSEQLQSTDDENNGKDEGEHSTDSSTSIARVVKDIYTESGLRGFWRGFETTLILCLNPSLTMFLYQAFRRVFLRGKDRQRPSPRQAFIGAATSNVIAVTILYPLILAKTRLQSARRARSSNKDVSVPQIPISMLDVWRAAYHRDGLIGLYQGLEAQLLKGFMSQGLAMMIKQRLEQIVIALYLYIYHIKAGNKKLL